MATMLFDTKADPEVQVRATLTRIIFNRDGFMIAAAEMDSGKRTTVLGAMDDPSLHQLYEFNGKEEHNARYGTKQLRFHSYRTILPSDDDGIVRYLSEAAKWVGPKHARQIVDKLGPDTLNALKTDPLRLAGAIAGLTNERLGEIQKALVANEAAEAATIEVNNLLAGVLGPSMTAKAIRLWGCDAASIIKRDPYKLTAMRGVGWTSADAVYKKLGKDPAARRRHAYAVIHVLNELAARNGHTVAQSLQLKADTKALVGPVRSGAMRLCLRTKSVVANNGTVQVADLAKAEAYVAGKIVAIMEQGGALRRRDGSERKWPAIAVDDLADDQVAAIKIIESSPVSILTGAPGTGKTYTLARAVKAMDAAGLRVALCAPTGKAAKQMTLALAEVCPKSAATIHSLLEPTVDLDTGEFRFERDETDPLDVDVVICDEFSMVDVRLARSLLRAIRPVDRLVIVGDHYQLPSVGPGAVLRDLLAASVPSAELTEIKRNAGLIVRACHALKDGKLPRPANRLDLESGDNWRHIDAGDSADIIETVKRLITEKLPEFGVEPKWQSQIISPTNEKGPLSCEALNKAIKPLVNPGAVPDKMLKFSIGDKIVRTKNGAAEECDPKAKGLDAGMKGEMLRIVNGDLGEVTHIDKSYVYVQFRWPDRHVKLRRREHHLRMAYCMTCHKMQGSEIDVVILPLSNSFARMPMWNREWVYTAFSRAKKFIVTVGSLAALRPAVSRVGTKLRKTTLCGRIAEAMGCDEANGQTDFSDI